MLFTILVLLSVLSLSGCDYDIRYGSGNVEAKGDSEDLPYLLTRITDLPDEWSSSKYMCYYYHIDTKVVYFGTSNLSTSAVLFELKSEEFRNYIYDEESNKFIGVN